MRGEQARPDHQGRDRVLAGLTLPVAERMQSYVDLLLRWQGTINLIAPATVPEVWTRHIEDSLQVHHAVPQARRWLDLGSGGGLPGLVTAIALSEHADAHVALVESDKRKAAFLQAVVRELGIKATVYAERIERFASRLDQHVDAVSARALAPLPKLLCFAHTFIEKGAVAVFPQGERSTAELTDLPAGPNYEMRSIPSNLRNGSSLLIIRAGAMGQPKR